MNFVAAQWNWAAKVDARTLGELLQEGSFRRVSRRGGSSRVAGDGAQQADSYPGHARVMNRIKAVYRGSGIPCSGQKVYAVRHHHEWLDKLTEPGMRHRTQRLYQQLDQFQPLRQQARGDQLRRDANSRPPNGCARFPASIRFGDCQFSEYRVILGAERILIGPPEEDMAARSSLMAVVLILSTLGIAQSAQVTAKPLTEKEIQLLRQDVQSVKDEVIKQAMQFTPRESAVFWPVYQEYAKAQHVIADKRLALITEYAQKLESMDDVTAANLTRRLFQIEDDAQALRKSYYPKIEKVLGAKRAAKFCQVDNRLSQLINLQLASEIPLIP
jgi:hypothetical protein